MQTIWSMTAGPRPDYRSTALPSRCDVVVIGAGFTGLTAALQLVRAGSSVVVIEAGRLGDGASGTNAGFVVPNFAKADPGTVRRKLGTERGNQLLNLVGSGADRVFETISEERIACDAARSGWLQPAYGRDMAEVLRARAADWRSLGRPVEFLEPHEVQAETGMDIYSGGLIDRSGGTIHPLDYVFGLARSVATHGGAIREGLAATVIAPKGTGYRVSHAEGTLSARFVLLATNAFTLGAAGLMGRTGIPLRVFQIATKPVDAATLARISPNRRPVGDTRANLFTYRLDRDNRLISGGMSLNPFASPHDVGRKVAMRLHSELGLARDPGLEAVWTGTALLTPDFLPRLYRFGENFYGGVGCNGRGIAMTAGLGAVLARLALGERAETLPVPLASQRPLPFHRFMPLVAAAGLAEARFSDWRKSRSAS